jgi:hypothetical protein
MSDTEVEARPFEHRIVARNSNMGEAADAFGADV